VEAVLDVLEARLVKVREELKRFEEQS